MKLTAPATLFAALALLAATSVRAATPPVTVYKARLAAICRANDPALTTYAKEILSAEKTKDSATLGFYLGRTLVVALQQDRAMYRIPVPAGARSTMTPLLARLHRADAIITSALAAAASGDSAMFFAELKALDPLSGPVNKLFDDFGLRVCGSGQP